MIIIGVTGNSGAGKTTVATTMKTNLNALNISADEIAKELMKPENDYYNDVIKLFGEEILYTEKSRKAGKIKRQKLAKILFTDSKKRENLNKLTFKYVGKELKSIIMEHKNDEYIILDIPLLYEGGFDKICNYVVAVVADEITKISRICSRDRINGNDARNRISTQMNEEFLKEHANFVIDNGGKNQYINLVNQTLKVIKAIKEEEKKEK